MGASASSSVPVASAAATEGPVDIGGPFPGYSFAYSINTALEIPKTEKQPLLKATMEQMGIPPLEWERTIELFMLPKSRDVCQGRFPTRTLFSEDKEFLLLIYREDGIYGALAFSFSKVDAYISEVCVNKELKGAGKKLMQIVEQIIQTLGIPTIKLIVGTTGENVRNTKLRNWYISQGYNYNNATEKASQSLEYPRMSKSLLRTAGGRRRGRGRVRKTRRRAGRRRSTYSYS